jgi:branched-chain amino acid transport system substrate-binding protein
MMKAAYSESGVIPDGIGNKYEEEKFMLKKTLQLAVALLLVLSLFAGCAGGGAKTSPAASGDQSSVSTGKPVDPNKSEILIGAVRSQTGVFALFDQTAFGPCYRMWVDKVNKDGGIFVKEYNKKLPVKLIVYDDTSDMGQMTQLYQKLILEDKVDFLLPPVSTAFLNAAVPIANQYGYLLIGAEGGSETLKASIAKYPNFFSVLSYSETQIPAQVELFKELGVTSVYIVFIQDTHGIEYSGAAAPAFSAAGINVVGLKAVPPDIADMTPVINDAKASGADAYVMYTYPDQAFPAIGIAKAVGYNPKAFLIGPGGSFDAIKLAMGGDAGVEGIMFEGAWNTKSSPEAKTFAEELQAFNASDKNFGMDWWGHMPYYTGLEVLQQAIEGAGTLDNAKVADYIKANHFQTVMGDTFFTNQELDPSCYKGQVGQWQNGFPEVVDVGANRTATPIYPKPEWAPAS